LPLPEQMRTEDNPLIMVWFTKDTLRSLAQQLRSEKISSFSLSTCQELM
jgi:hypothetical protein